MQSNYSDIYRKRTYRKHTITRTFNASHIQKTLSSQLITIDREHAIGTIHNHAQQHKKTNWRDKKHTIGQFLWWWDKHVFMNRVGPEFRAINTHNMSFTFYSIKQPFVLFNWLRQANTKLTCPQWMSRTGWKKVKMYKCVVKYYLSRRKFIPWLWNFMEFILIRSNLSFD